MDDENHYLTISRIGLKELYSVSERVREVILHDTVWVMNKAGFERKIGWSTPPINLGNNEIVALLHGVDYDLEAYCLYAVQLEYSRSEGIIVKAVTPTYIIEPKLLYEIFGDRPYTIFPCGT